MPKRKRQRLQRPQPANPAHSLALPAQRRLRTCSPPCPSRCPPFTFTPVHSRTAPARTWPVRQSQSSRSRLPQMLVVQVFSVHSQQGVSRLPVNSWQLSMKRMRMVATRRNYSRFADILIEKGYRRIHLLFDETPKSLQNDLGLPISMGDAKQLLMHVKSACRKIALLDY